MERYYKTMNRYDKAKILKNQQYCSHNRNRQIWKKTVKADICENCGSCLKGADLTVLVNHKNNNCGQDPLNPES